MDKPCNIIFAGVGGQGVLTASETLARASLLSALDVKKSEVHGMAQRGGSVSSHVRFGPRVYSPLIPQGTADFLVALEGIEALRFAHMVKPGGVIILDRLTIQAQGGQPVCQDEVEDTLARLDLEVLAVPAQELALSAGDKRAAGSVLQGVLAVFLPLSAASWAKAFECTLRPEVAGLNMEAFRHGRSWISTALK